ncbi:MAG TPA: aspartate-semialdehyde dehydrogenase [Candidatus Thermoplasmatota archaeon]|nr:aspartate-semialdehyde dehydrogenase [Candidatus Thermoplasmatota archaeon]
MKTKNAAVLGATGTVGQKFIRLLENHPQFKLTEVVASERSGGKKYVEAVRWMEDTPIPKAVRDLEVKNDTYDLDADVCFSALPGGKAEVAERELAKRGYGVFTNARDLRMAPDVPLVIAEVNPDHLDLIDKQKKAAKSDGFVVANGNCTAIVLTMALKPLLDDFGLKHVSVTSMQAISGAGYPGVASLDITENIIPYIGGGEEEKMETEPRKFLGTLRNGAVEPADFALSVTCTRVPVVEGHTEAVHVSFRKKATVAEVVESFRSFRGKPQSLKLPSAPEHAIVVRDEVDRPQPRKDRSAGNYMSVVVGRVRPDPVFDVKFVCLGSNTVRGAAGGSILNAELAAKLGHL